MLVGNECWDEVPAGEADTFQRKETTKLCEVCVRTCRRSLWHALRWGDGWMTGTATGSCGTLCTERSAFITLNIRKQLRCVEMRNEGMYTLIQLYGSGILARSPGSRPHKHLAFYARACF